MFKILIITALIALAQAQGQWVPIPGCNIPNPQNPTHVVLVPYPADCTKFYKCLGGQGSKIDKRF